LQGVRTGLLHLFLQHTSASLSINENADADVPRDLEDAFSDLAPENRPYRHTCEGPDDMPAHVKASMIGCSLTIPINQGRLCLGTWQGIYLCEHRNRAGRRRVVATIWGEFDSAGGDG
jgi:secondary thiamine-phosphate synthase enzyme